MPERPDIDRLLATAGAVLSETWGGAVTLYLQDPIRSEWGRHTVLLCHVDGPSDAPAMVVVKAAVEPDGAVFNEWACLEWLGGIEEVADRLPALYGGDEEAQLIVLGDVGAGPTVHRVLQSQAQWALDALTDGQALTAAVHAATRGREAEFAAVRSRLPEGAAPPRLVTDAAELAAWSPLSDAVLEELVWVREKMDVPESFRALTFHDQCQVNRIVTTTGVRAVDLEMAGFRNAMIDGSFGAIGHLRCMARRLRDDDAIALPQRVRQAATRAYRSGVVAGYPEYEDDDRFDDDLTAAAAVWLGFILTRSGPMGDESVSFFKVTAAQRAVAALEAFIELADATNRLPGLAAWAGGLHERLLTEWPDLPPLPVAAAFREG